MKDNEKSARLTAKVAVICTIVTVVVQITGFVWNIHEKHNEELMQHRREALFSALQVVDHVYANSEFNNRPASNPHQWDISQTRDAMNGIIIYSRDPNVVLDSFSKAIGMHNPDTENVPMFGPKGLAEFRDVVCEELGVSGVQYLNTNQIWIYKLPGAK